MDTLSALHMRLTEQLDRADENLSGAVPDYWEGPAADAYEEHRRFTAIDLWRVKAQVMAMRVSLARVEESASTATMVRAAVGVGAGW